MISNEENTKNNIKKILEFIKRDNIDINPGKYFPSIPLDNFNFNDKKTNDIIKLKEKLEKDLDDNKIDIKKVKI